MMTYMMIGLRRCIQSRKFSSSKDVILDKSQNGHFASIILNRTEVHNALSPSIMTGIVESLDQLRNDQKVRAIFLKANGKTFCSGGDLKHMKSTATWTYDQNKVEAFNLSSVFNSL
jgi:enoyl-CoA hydratase/carnithine racemase